MAKAELIDVQSETRLVGRTKNLSLAGCFVETASSSPNGVKVRLRISRGSAGVVAMGKVVYSEPKGMGIAFATIELGGLAVLDNWIASRNPE